MSGKIHLTLATGDYESIRALKEGTVKPDGIELTVLTDMNSDIRHWRMLRNREFMSVRTVSSMPSGLTVPSFNARMSSPVA